MHGIIGQPRDAREAFTLPALNAAAINREAALADECYRQSVAHALRCGELHGDASPKCRCAKRSKPCAAPTLAAKRRMLHAK